ncbi:DNA topoisomerase 2, partial [Tanacetum coccineum]
DGIDFDQKEKCIRYVDFINKDFKQYAMADLEKSIPSMVDGLKPHQRKILFYAFTKPIIEEIGVAEFSGYVFEHSPYHQGEASLVSTIIGMAQNYVGSNNINLLQPKGQFGTRWMGGKDHASGRFLFTQLSPITQYLFHKDDEQLLNYLKEDDQFIQPEWYIPIIPLVLVNGSEAGGALSSFIPNYNPRDIIANLQRLLKGKKTVPMLPWYKDFKGEIEKRESNLYTTKGITTVDDYKNALTITELPVRTWTEDYKDFLDSACDIKDYEARNHNTSVHFKITMTEDQMNKARQEEFLNKFKLTTTLSTANMYLFDAKGKLKKYNTPEQILEDFFHFRLDFYKKRRIALLRELKKASMILENKMRFIRLVWEQKIVFNKKKDERCASLEAQGFDSLPEIESKVDLVLRKETEKEEEVAAGEEKPQGNAREVTRYDYLLLSTPAASMEDEDLEELKKEKEAKDKKFDELLSPTITPVSLWLTDLKALNDQLRAGKYGFYPLTLKNKQISRVLNETKMNAVPVQSREQEADRICSFNYEFQKWWELCLLSWDVFNVNLPLTS